MLEPIQPPEVQQHGNLVTAIPFPALDAVAPHLPRKHLHGNLDEVLALEEMGPHGQRKNPLTAPPTRKGDRGRHQPTTHFPARPIRMDGQRSNFVEAVPEVTHGDRSDEPLVRKGSQEVRQIHTDFLGAARQDEPVLHIGPQQSGNRLGLLGAGLSDGEESPPGPQPR